MISPAAAMSSDCISIPRPDSRNIGTRDMEENADLGNDMRPNITVHSLHPSQVSPQVSTISKTDTLSDVPDYRDSEGNRVYYGSNSDESSKNGDISCYDDIKPRHEYRSSRHNRELEAPGTTLYISNVPLGATVGDLWRMFEVHGKLKDCRIIADPVSKQSRGFAFAHFESVEEADNAIVKTDGKEICGSIVTVERAKRSRPHKPTPGQYKGPTGASIKYDSKGKLKPGFVPYWQISVPKMGHSYNDDRHRYSHHDSPQPLLRSAQYEDPSAYRSVYNSDSKNKHESDMYPPIYRKRDYGTRRRSMSSQRIKSESQSYIKQHYEGGMGHRFDDRRFGTAIEAPRKLYTDIPHRRREPSVEVYRESGRRTGSRNEGGTGTYRSGHVSYKFLGLSRDQRDSHYGGHQDSGISISDKYRYEDVGGSSRGVRSDRQSFGSFHNSWSMDKSVGRAPAIVPIGTSTPRVYTKRVHGYGMPKALSSDHGMEGGARPHLPTPYTTWQRGYGNVSQYEPKKTFSNMGHLGRGEDVNEPYMHRPRRRTSDYRTMRYRSRSRDRK